MREMSSDLDHLASIVRLASFYDAAPRVRTLGASLQRRVGRVNALNGIYRECAPRVHDDGLHYHLWAPEFGRAPLRLGRQGRPERPRLSLQCQFSGALSNLVECEPQRVSGDGRHWVCRMASASARLCPHDEQT
jgi:hypothetical protein